jgi:hypothetical protein
MKLIVTVFVILLSFSSTQAQITGFDKSLKVGELLVNGLLVLKGGKSARQDDSKTVEKVCIKNKFPEKLGVKFHGNFKTDDTSESETFDKELVIPKSGKECLYDLPKGVWDYEFTLANGEVYKKGQLKIDGEITITAGE